MDISNIDKAEKLIADCRRLEEENKDFEKILESPKRYPLGGADYGQFSFENINGTGLVYNLNLRREDIEALYDERITEIEEIKARLEKL